MHAIAHRTAVAAALATVAVLAAARTIAQSPTALPDYIAFRLDDHRAIAIVAVFDDASARQVREGLSRSPAARYGFAFHDVPTRWRARVPDAVATTDLWTLHTSPGRQVAAIADRIVGGSAQCRSAVGVLLEIPPEHRDEFSRVSSHYFVAAPAVHAPVAVPRSRLGSFPLELSSTQRQQVEELLSDVLRRELPAVASKAAVDAPGQRDPNRARIDAALVAGGGRLAYDVQAYRLGPDPAPVLFVRARWFVDSTLGFAAGFWLRVNAGGGVDVIDQDLVAASWLRMPLSRGRVHDASIGLVLNVFDLDGDGWAEILVAREGYESVTMKLRKYQPQGFVDGDLEALQGC